MEIHNWKMNLNKLNNGDLQNWIMEIYKRIAEFNIEL